jgi:hypothetical protein
MAGEMVKTVVSLTALYAALIAMGGKATDDPNDPDFFKVKIRKYALRSNRRNGRNA